MILVGAVVVVQVVITGMGPVHGVEDDVGVVGGGGRGARGE